MKKQCRGFQCISKSARKKISKMGAKALHDQGKAYKFDSKSAKRASKKAIAAKLSYQRK